MALQQHAKGNEMSPVYSRAFFAGCALAVSSLIATATAAPVAEPRAPTAKELESICALLDDPHKRALMDARWRLETRGMRKARVGGSVDRMRQAAYRR